MKIVELPDSYHRHLINQSGNIIGSEDVNGKIIVFPEVRTRCGCGCDREIVLVIANGAVGFVTVTYIGGWLS